MTTLILLGTVCLQNPAQAADVEVDVELVLAVDVSRSMTERELEIQRRGYAAALSSEPVIKAIVSGLHGKVAITYVEWAGQFSQRTIVPWTLIENEQQAFAFAAKLTAKFNSSLRRTSLSGALDHAAGLFQGNGFSSLRRVIDVSGDGPNNDGRPVLQAREEAISQGIVINGLPLMTNEGLGTQFHLVDLDDYYRHCVIGGPGSFVIPVLEWAQFPQAVRQKLVLELAGLAPAQRYLPQPVAFSGATEDGYDCMIGEKIWGRMRLYWSLP
ncbi:MAG: DUF1194 domain-containing protein [Pseudomonadota bacterium]